MRSPKLIWKCPYCPKMFPEIAPAEAHIQERHFKQVGTYSNRSFSSTSKRPKVNMEVGSMFFSNAEEAMG